jgi:hypothetical protein
MKTLFTIISLVVCTGVAAAQTTPLTVKPTEVRGNRGQLTSANAPCAAKALEVREDALITGHKKRVAAITTGLEARKKELKAAWLITDQAKRRTAREAALKKFQGVAEAAQKEFKAAANTAYTTFNASVRTCGIEQYTEAMSNDKSATQ